MKKRPVNKFWAAEHGLKMLRAVLGRFPNFLLHLPTPNIPGR